MHAEPKHEIGQGRRLGTADGVSNVDRDGHHALYRTAVQVFTSTFDTRPRLLNLLGSCWIPGSWMCRGRTTPLLSPFPPGSPSFSMAFNKEVRFSDHGGA